MAWDSLRHALEVLRSQTLSSRDRDRALCYASLGNDGADQDDESIRYFEQISNIQNLHKNECHLLLCTLGKIYIKKGDHEKGIALKHQGIDALDPTEAPYFVQKYDLAKVYGQVGNIEKETEMYGEILEGIRTISFGLEWKERMKSIQMSIETTFFLKELDEVERHFQEQLDQRKREREVQKVQEKEVSKEKSHQKKLSQRMIDEIKQAQKEAAEREKRLDEEKRKKFVEQKVRNESRKSYPMEKPESFFVEQSFSQATRYVPESKASKVKTRGKVATVHEKEDEKLLSETLFPTFPQLGTRAQKVFHQIEDEDWDFTREEYSCLLTDLQCERRETASSHRVFQLPKTTILTLERNGEEIQEHIFWADEDITLGSVTLPAWREKVPLYLRKQLRLFHSKIIEMYTKITAMRQTLFAEDNVS
ncbi:MAG: hypothetical protein JSS34_07260 [Proteobacteria bacterium]|nr:hypothetical protein [Pseudomonadota bacterium]